MNPELYQITRHHYFVLAREELEWYCRYQWANSYMLFTCVLLSTLIYLACMDDFLSEPLGLEDVVYLLTKNK